MKKKTNDEILANKKEFDINSIFSMNDADFGVKGVLKEFINDKDVKTKSHLGLNEINTITRGIIISDYLDEKGLNGGAIRRYYTEIMTMRISLNRLSRGELIQAMQSENKKEEMNPRETIKT